MSRISVRLLRLFTGNIGRQQRVREFPPMWFTRSAVLAVLALLLIPLSAMAGGFSDCSLIPDCAQRRSGANTLAQAGSFDAALLEYEELYAKYLDPRLWYNTARLLHKQGRPAESIQYYRRFIESGVETNAQRLEKTRSFLEQAQAEALQGSANQRQLNEQRQQEEARAQEERARAAKTPLHKRWWLWTAVGVVVVAGAVGLGLGLGSVQPSFPNTPELRPFP